MPFDSIKTEVNCTHFTNALMYLRDQKVRPDVILVHVGFGVERLCRYFFPDAPLVGYCEWYFSESPLFDVPRRVSDVVKNHGIRTQLQDCDYLVSPTRIQRQQYPAEYRRRIRLLHEGVDTVYWCPLSPTAVASTTKLITYVSRGLEPTRKFLEFIDGLKLVLDIRPDVRVKVVGKDKVYYSDHDSSYLEMAKKALGDEHCRRVDFLLDVPKATVKSVLQASDVHVYFTELFVPSWSMIEAMAAGCLMVASDNEACREFLEHEVSGLLVDHSRAPAVRNSIVRALNMARPARAAMCAAARNAIVNGYSSSGAEAKWGETLEAISL